MFSTILSRGLIGLTVFAATFTAAYAQGRVATSAARGARTT